MLTKMSLNMNATITDKRNPTATIMAWPSIYGLDSATLSGQTPAPTRPTILLVHDSFMAPAHFTPLTTELTNAAFRVLCPQLPSCTTAYKPNAIEADVQTVFQACLSDLYGGRDIVVVMSGYGGIVGSVVAARLNEHSLDRPGAGMVSGMIFVSAMALQNGESFSDVLHATSDIHRVRVNPRTQRLNGVWMLISTVDIERSNHTSHL